MVPVWRELLADLQTPVAAFLKLDPRPNGFLLESVEQGERWGRYSFVGGDAVAVVKAKDGRISVEGTPPASPRPGESPLRYVRRLLAECRVPRSSGLPDLHGGALGFLGYDCVRELERLPDAPADDLGLPDLALLMTRTLVVFDHLLQKATVVSNVVIDPGRGPLDAAYDDAASRCDELVERLSAPLGHAPVAARLPVAPEVELVSDVDDGEFERWVATAREHIRAGDVFQVVPSRRFGARLRASSFSAYRVLRVLNPSPYMYFLRFDAAAEGEGFEIAGSSPEPLVKVSGDRVVTRPIAGTRPRGTNDEEDKALERDLLDDQKERAEHVMLVDLARNDLGRVARFGTVTVDDFMVVERYSHVMHLVSSVTGTLRDGVDGFDALTACFPAGTVSGAPKVRAMEIIDSLEPTRRGPYAGVVGYFAFSGDLDTCITIRSFVATGGTAYVQAGAGVVADSQPEAEAEETRRKAQAVVSALAAAPLLEQPTG